MLNFILNNAKFLFFIILFINKNIYAQKTLGLIKQKAGATVDGYTLLAPIGNKNTYLIDKCGKIVKQWQSNYGPGISCYLLEDGSLLRTANLQDTFFPTNGKGGLIEKYSWDGNLIWSYKISNDSLGQHHDICPLENGNILVIAWHGISISEAERKGRITNSIIGNKLWSERILEIKPKGTNDVDIVWQWSLWDHIVQHDNGFKPNYKVISQNPQLLNINFAPNPTSDWIHLNSIDYNPKSDHIMLTAHSLNEIWIIDHSTTTDEAKTSLGGNSNKGGDLLYRWGNPIAYENGVQADQKLFGPHNAHWIPGGLQDSGKVLIFNNGLGRDSSYSSIEMLNLPIDMSGNYETSLPYGPNKPTWQYKDPNPLNFYSAFISGVQRMPNGNTQICSGINGRIFEINPSKSIVWEYINPVAGNSILTDGDIPLGNLVFRAPYFSKDYKAFKNKTLLTGGPIELNPKQYSCFEMIKDTISPSIVSKFPSHLSNNIATNTVLQINFNESIYKNNGNISIYENHILKEQIQVNSPNIIINKKNVSIIPSSIFSYNSIINIKIDHGTFKDSTGNLISLNDTSVWKFNTQKQMGISLLDHPHFHIYPNPSINVVNINYDKLIPDVKIFDAYGNKMELNYVNNHNTISINTEKYSEGVYQIKLENENYPLMIIR